MSERQSIKVVFSYAHKDEDHHRRLAEHLDRLRRERSIDSWKSLECWDDRELLPGADWDRKIRDEFESADIILLLVSARFLESEYVRETEIPLALSQAKDGKSEVVPVILEKCDWQQYELSEWQVLPPGAAPIVEWPSLDVAYAEVARGVLSLVNVLQQGINEEVERERNKRERTIFDQYPFRILGEDYDPFRAFEQVFRRVETRKHVGLPPLPLTVPLEKRVVFDGQDYRSILTELRHTDQRTGLPYDLVAIPYPLLGHCVEAGLIQPLDAELLSEYELNFAWWNEMGRYQNRLYGIPLSALTMVLAIREDLFDDNGLEPPDSWEDYLALVDRVIDEPIIDKTSGKSIAPGLLQGRCHITLWCDWLTHLYANNSSDREIYGGNRFSPGEAAETLRAGTSSYLDLAAKLAPYADGKNLPHYATANWDDGINEFAAGKLLMHFMFNDALETQRMRMEVPLEKGGKPFRIRYLPMPTSVGRDIRHGHVEGWVLCVPVRTHYREAANDILHWFLDIDVQRAYATWGGLSAHREVIIDQAARVDNAGAGKAYLDSVEACMEARASVDAIKYKGAEALPAIDRIKENLYEAVLTVARKQGTVEEATDTLLKQVEKRLLRGNV